MSISHHIEINAPANVIFSLYDDPKTWPDWDSETLEVSLPSLQLSAMGWLKPKSGPKAKIRVTEVVPNRSFTIEGLLPFCRMQFGHDLEVDAGRTIATHWVRFIGPLAFVFRRLIGGGIDRTLPSTLSGLKQASEQRNTQL